MGNIPVVTIVDLLELKRVDKHTFHSVHHQKNFRDSLFGGQVLGQALAATCTTVDKRLPHSLHAYFLRPGTNAEPVIYKTEVLRDGKSFSSRRAVAMQYGKPIFNLSASFHTTEPGFSHQPPMPDVPPPERLCPSNTAPPELAKEKTERSGKERSGHPLLGDFDVRPASNTVLNDPAIQAPKAAFWFKTRRAISDDPIFNHSALAYLSDIGLLASALLPHPTTLFRGDIIAASIDHAMWFHTPDFSVNEWLLCCTESPWAGSARGFATSHIYNQAGILIASATQEGLIRPIDEALKDAATQQK